MALTGEVAFLCSKWDPRVQLASLQPRETFALDVRALGSQLLRSTAMFTQCRIHAPFMLHESRRRFKMGQKGRRGELSQNRAKITYRLSTLSVDERLPRSTITLPRIRARIF